MVFFPHFRGTPLVQHVRVVMKQLTEVLKSPQTKVSYDNIPIFDTHKNIFAAEVRVRRILCDSRKFVHTFSYFKSDQRLFDRLKSVVLSRMENCIKRQPLRHKNLQYLVFFVEVNSFKSTGVVLGFATIDKLVELSSFFKKLLQFV